MKLSYEVIRFVEGFEGLRAEWTTLLDAGRIGSPFLTWEWMFTWWQRYCGSRPDRQLAVVVARRGSSVVAILPGYVRSRLGVATWALLGTEFESSDYLRVIEAPGESALPGLIEHLRSAMPVDVVELANVLSTDSFVRDVEQYTSGAGAPCEVVPHRVCPFIDVRGIGSFDTFMAARSSNIRRKTVRPARRLAESGVVFDWVTERADVGPAIADLFALHAKRFTVKDGESLFKAELRQPFHQELAERFFDRGVLRLFRLRDNGQTIATMYCFESGGSLYYFQSGIDPDPKWEAHSVGMVTMLHAIQYAFDHGLTMFDFMRGAEPYKYRWTSTERHLVVVRLGTSLKGRVALSAARQFAGLKAGVKRLIRRERPVAAVPVAHQA